MTETDQSAEQMAREVIANAVYSGKLNFATDEEAAKLILSRLAAHDPPLVVVTKQEYENWKACGQYYHARELKERLGEA